MAAKILIAEDDADIQEILKLYLENAGFTVIRADDGTAAFEKITQDWPDLVLVDIMMPGMNGFELTKRIRACSNIPIIIISAMNADSDKILGLDIGADDYVTKPFNPLEVVARVKSALRRTMELDAGDQSAGSGEADLLRVGELVLDTKRFMLTKNGEQIPLTPTEFKILMMLMENPGRVFTKMQIYERINGEYFESDDNTMMVHISKLRDKIGDDSKHPVYLKTIRGLGYKIEEFK